MKCPFSGSADIPQQDQKRLLLPVECPECGAIRRPVLGIWQETPQTYGEHLTLDGTAHKRRGWWKKIDGTWQIAEAEQDE